LTVTLAVALPMLLAHDAAIDLGDPETPRIPLGGIMYLVAIAHLAFAIGALVWVSAGALATALGRLVVTENAFWAIAPTFFRSVSHFLPATAGHRKTTVLATIDQFRGSSTATVLNPWQGYGVMTLWVVILLAEAAVFQRCRDV
jgi:ABC-2 type transport system permease protein